MTTDEIRRHYPSIVGEVVETYQKDGEQFAKIVLRNCHIELPLTMLDDAHLGDKISLQADVVVSGARIIPHTGLNGDVYFTEECTD
jgi:hypothetical protein